MVDYKFKKRRKLTVGNISLERDIGYAKEYTEAIFKILSTGKNSKYIVSANRLSSLEDFIINCLNLLDIKYERISSKDSLSFVSKDGSGQREDVKRPMYHGKPMIREWIEKITKIY